LCRMFRAGNPWERGRVTMSADRRVLLGSLFADPATVSEIPPEEVAALMGDLAGAQAVLAARLRVPSGPPARARSQAEADRLLTPEEAAGVLGVGVRWLYRHARQLAFTRRLSRKMLRFSEVGLRRYMAGKGS
jgi:hypothetical protein